jgi:hypothetical protein
MTQNAHSMLAELEGGLRELEHFVWQTLHGSPVEACKLAGHLHAQIDSLAQSGIDPEVVDKFRGRVVEAQAELDILSGLNNPRLAQSRAHAGVHAASYRQAVFSYFPSAVKYLLTAHGAAAIACLGAIASAFDKPLVPALIAAIGTLAQGLVFAALALPLNFLANGLLGANWDALSQPDGDYRNWRRHAAVALDLLASLSLGYSLFLLQQAIAQGAGDVLSAYYSVGAPFWDP